MAIGEGKACGRHLRTLFNVGAVRDLTDGQLLERFATGRGEAAELAFAALVERHGPMVFRVARGILDDPHDAEDAFQATFLVMFAKARGLWARDSLGPWLHQVARRTACCQRSSAARRRRLDRRAATAEGSARPEAVDDLDRVLHEEIDRLPERYRAPVVLCDLEGKTHEQAARALGWPVGTVKSRQARARQRLLERLTRRGVVPAVALESIGPALNPSLPMTLVEGTTAAAVRTVASRAIVPGTAAALAREALRAMTILRWTRTASALIVLGAASGAGLIAQGPGDRPGDGPKPAETSQQSPAVGPSVVEIKPGKLSFTLSERGVVESSSVRDGFCDVEGGATIISIKPEGTRVEKGEVVCELDAASLRDRLNNQKIGVLQAEKGWKLAKIAREDAEVAEVAVKEYVEGIGPLELQESQGKVATARAGIEKGQARLERTRSARKRLDEALSRRAGPETPADVATDLTISDRLDEAELAVPALKLDLEMSQNRTALLQKYTLQKTTRRLQVDVERARQDELAKESAWQLERSKPSKLERQIKACVLAAPTDGIVTYANDPRSLSGQNRLQIEEGSIVRQNQKIFSVIDLAAPMRIRTKVREALVDRVRPGQPVRIRVEAALNQVLNGVVRSVAPMADVRYSANDPKVYTTFIEFEQGNLNLRPGMTASAEVLIFEHDDVLSVPFASVVRIDGKDRVAVKTPEGSIELREVTLGEANAEAFEVKRGLRPGDRVFLDPLAREPKPRKTAVRQDPAQTPTTTPAKPDAPR